MADTLYVHALSAFPNGKCEVGSFDQEVRDSSITVALKSISIAGADVNITFKAALSAGEESTLTALVAAHQGVVVSDAPTPVVLKAPDGTDLEQLNGRQRVVVEKPDSSSATFYSHDWTDPTTWLHKAVRVVDETAIRIDAKKYRVLRDNLIDTYHGKITQEDYKTDSGGHSYRVIVKVAGQTKVEDDPHYGGANGDYCIDYESGVIHFHFDVDIADAVVVTYHYATTSEVLIVPSAGKILRLDLVEVQFATNVDIRDSAIFQAEGYAAAFAPALVGAPDGTAGVFAVGGATGAGGTIAATDRIPLGAPSVYKGMRDYQNDALRSYPAYPAMGGSSWRGMTSDVLIFDWDYLRAKTLYSSAGMQIRVRLEHDVPFGGDYATTTFYCGVEDE